MATDVQIRPHGREPARDAMPIHGIDHLELFVGNAAQSAYYYTRAFGFTETAYRGLETGSRDRVSHVLEQGRIRLVLTGTLTGEDEIAEHHKRHGDGVHAIALSVPDAAAAYEHAVANGARGLETPYELSDGTGRVGSPRSPPTARRATCSSSATATRARSSPGSSPASRNRQAPTACSPASTTSSATSSSAIWTNGSATTSACSE